MLGYSLEVGVIVAINTIVCLAALFTLDGWQNDFAAISIWVGQAWMWKKLDY